MSEVLPTESVYRLVTPGWVYGCYLVVVSLGGVLLAGGFAVGATSLVLLGALIAVSGYLILFVGQRRIERRFGDGRPGVAVARVEFRDGRFAAGGRAANVIVGGPAAWRVRFADGVQATYSDTPELRAALAARVSDPPDIGMLKELNPGTW